MPQVAESIRSFAQEVEERFSKLSHRLHCRSLGTVSYGGAEHPILAAGPLRATPRTARKSVLISAGVHGDEPAGVYASLQLIESSLDHWKETFDFYVLPCINPSGFEGNTLETATGENLNRLFGIGSKQSEIQAVEGWLREIDQTFAVTFDLHEVVPTYRGEGFVESDNPRACYLYETQGDLDRRIGKRMLAALQGTAEVCKWPRVYNDRNNDGLVSYPEACGNAVYAQGTTLDGFLHSRYTDHSFTLETPTGWPIGKRIQTHLTWLTTALELLRSS